MNYKWSESSFSATRFLRLLELWQWRCAVKKGLIEDELNPTLISYFSWRMMSLPIVGAAAVLIGLISPWFSGFAFLMMPITQRIINSRFAIDANKMEVIEDGLET